MTFLPSRIPLGESGEDEEVHIEDVAPMNRDHEYGANDRGSLPGGGQGDHPTFNPTAFLEKQISLAVI